MGTTWSENSYHNRLTPWSNDPVVDPPSEVVYLRDDESGEFWTATPSPAAGAVKHVARFGQGYASYGHRHRGLDVELIAFVPKDDPIKMMRLRIRNTTTAARELSAFYYVEWCLADTRSRSAAHIVTSIDTVCGALFARNAFRAGFGTRVAFIDAVAAEPIDDGRPVELHRTERHALRSAGDGVCASARAGRGGPRSMRSGPEHAQRGSGGIG